MKNIYQINNEEVNRLACKYLNMALEWDIINGEYTDKTVCSALAIEGDEVTLKYLYASKMWLAKFVIATDTYKTKEFVVQNQDINNALCRLLVLYFSSKEI